MKAEIVESSMRFLPEICVSPCSLNQLNVRFLLVIPFVVVWFSMVLSAQDTISPANVTAPPESELDENSKSSVVYKSIEGHDLTMTVFLPAKGANRTSHNKKRPAILFFHGGGWVGGSPGQFQSQAEHFSSRGLVCFSVQYRLLNKDDPTQPPDICLEDARDAFIWVRDHADDYQIDKNRIAGAGGSAGGHLAAACGMIDLDGKPFSARPQALLLFNPVYDNGPGKKPFGYGQKRVGGRYRELSPAYNVSQDDPPMLLLLGSEDKFVSPEMAREFQKDLQEAGVRCDLIVYPGAKHGFFNTDQSPENYRQATTKAADDFLVSLGWIAAESP